LHGFSARRSFISRFASAPRRLRLCSNFGVSGVEKISPPVAANSSLRLRRMRRSILRPPRQCDNFSTNGRNSLAFRRFDHNIPFFRSYQRSRHIRSISNARFILPNLRCAFKCRASCIKAKGERIKDEAKELFYFRLSPLSFRAGQVWNHERESVPCSSKSFRSQAHSVSISLISVEDFTGNFRVQHIAFASAIRYESSADVGVFRQL